MRPIEDPTCEDNAAASGASHAKGNGIKVWIDFDNSPHVPFFEPIIKELHASGYSTVLTGRDAFQVKELVKLHNLDCNIVGSHYGKHTVWKLLGLIIRVLKLFPIVLRQKPALALAHVSRAQLLVAKVLRIPTIWITDYECAKGLPLFHADWLMLPVVIPVETVNYKESRILRYPGIKEDVYVPAFRPDPSIREELRLNETDLVVTVRPPAVEAHYHTALSDELFRAAMDYLGEQPHLKLVVLPRNHRQEVDVKQAWPQLFESGKAMILPHAVDGLNLIWHSDFVVSGGGTMNREAAALGVPVYSIFGGAIGAVDRSLAESGRLNLLRTANDVRTKIQLVHRNTNGNPARIKSAALESVVENILSVLSLNSGQRKRALPGQR
jgi:uncharacterized protein